MAEEQAYVLGTHDAELERLGLQHRLWAAQTAACWEAAGIGPGKTVLEIGCGPGYTTLDLAQLVLPGGRVMAVDQSERFLAHLSDQARARGLRNVETRAIDVQRLDLPEASVDVCYGRWVLCFVADVDAVVAGVARTLRSGGVFAAQEYVNYTAIQLAPETDPFRRVIGAVARSWREHGGDPNVGTRLPAGMERHGLRVEAVRPILRAARPADPLWQWPTTFWESYLPVLREMGFLTDEDVRAFEDDWAAHTHDPGAFFLSPPMVEVIARKP
jgi:SAM-dependent methyltransferase